MRYRASIFTSPIAVRSVSPTTDFSLNRDKIHAADEARTIICLRHFNC
ncbi:hypothetical protein DND58_05415 [Pseudomonas syringae pv. pisi]|nr:hypothetical protein N032_20180 [Pseudomonas syringae pv. pisi str. PP1]PYD18053.1 hypothetical protein DND62_01325 [Pseudomonas syringae pv. pisi]PYD32821.1 hypothetical protein DND58_05415 [Pseudomonas syringae pv. pisi]PYD35317.1 hypothetical protein DND67_05130 [Pseudomonas syringae pv. pisi]RMM24966.1 hypothetical protein ALQ81_05556 [Pseudomonas syringae pv. pisi]